MLPRFWRAKSKRGKDAGSLASCLSGRPRTRPRAALRPPGTRRTFAEGALWNDRDAVDLDLADDQVGTDRRTCRPRLGEERLVDAVHPGEILEVDEPDAAADDVLEA